MRELFRFRPFLQIAGVLARRYNYVSPKFLLRKEILGTITKHRNNPLDGFIMSLGQVLQCFWILFVQAHNFEVYFQSKIFIRHTSHFHLQLSTSLITLWTSERCWSLTIFDMWKEEVECFFIPSTIGMH